VTDVPATAVGLPPEVREVLARLSADYAAQLPDRLAAVRTHWDALSGGDATAADPFLRAVHYLAGTGATFGRADVSDLANRLEALLSDAAPASPDPAAAQPLVDALCATGAPS
jgi:hypothetical protein